MTQALVVIDVQNDYFPGGGLPLVNMQPVLERIVSAIGKAREAGFMIVLVQHVSPHLGKPSGLFDAGTSGVAVHPAILAAAPGASLVVKQQADSFHGTDLAARLKEAGVTQLVLCGMMTQNCVVFTALSRAAEAYSVTVLADCCTSVSEIVHRVALRGLGLRVDLRESDDYFGAIHGAGGSEGSGSLRLNG